MQGRLFPNILFWMAFFLFSQASANAGPYPPGSPENPLRMIFVPSGEAQVILEGGTQIARLLKESTGLHFKTSVATSYAAAIEAMGTGKVDIGWLATFSYVLATEKYGVDLMLIVSRFGSAFYRGQIVVNAQSDIHSLADLQGKSVAFVDPVSTSGHIFPKTLIASSGHDPETFFSKSVFAGSHNAVILSVMKGEVDAGATYDDARAAIAKSFPQVFEKVRVVAYTREIPNDTVCARKGLDPGIRERVKNALIHLSKSPRGGKILKKVYGISGLMDFDAFFDPVRQARRLLQLDPAKIR